MASIYLKRHFWRYYFSIWKFIIFLTSPLRLYCMFKKNITSIELIYDPVIKISCEYMLVTLLLKNMQVVARKNEKWYKDSCKRIRGLTQMYENHISVMFLLPTAHENECISSFKKLAYVFTIRNVTFYSVRYWSFYGSYKLKCITEHLFCT